MAEYCALLFTLSQHTFNDDISIVHWYFSLQHLVSACSVLQFQRATDYWLINCWRTQLAIEIILCYSLVSKHGFIHYRKGQAQLQLLPSLLKPKLQVWNLQQLNSTQCQKLQIMLTTLKCLIKPKRFISFMITQKHQTVSYKKNVYNPILYDSLILRLRKYLTTTIRSVNGIWSPDPWI